MLNFLQKILLIGRTRLENRKKAIVLTIQHSSKYVFSSYKHSIPTSSYLPTYKLNFMRCVAPMLCQRHLVLVLSL